MPSFNSVIALLALFLLAGTILAGTDGTIVVIGEISDSQCALNVHSMDGSHTAMIATHILGRNPAECTRACAGSGGKYVLLDSVNNEIYRLSAEKQVQQLAEKFAGRKVRVQGTCDKSGVFTIKSIRAR